MLTDIHALADHFLIVLPNINSSVSFGVRYVHGLRLMHHSLINHFGSTCWYFGEEAQVEARFDLFGDSANLDAR